MKKGSNPPPTFKKPPPPPAPPRPLGSACSDLLNAIRVAKDKVRVAKKERCSCSGFVLQYEGSCQCGVGSRIRAAQTELNNLVERI